MYKIRKMTSEDYGGVYRLWLETPNMGLNSLDDSREGIEKYLERNPDTCFAAFSEGRIVGAILAGHDGRRGYIYHTAVARDERGKGIGTALTDAAADALLQAGITKAALVVFAKNLDGNAFWEKRGFISRPDLVYRNKTLREHKRIET